jgi:crotonobetainyl-CoA:carnitine CoA-transferase CaiB-like acyl-CoA transferase
LTLLDSFGSYSAPINTYPQLLQHPQTQALGLFRSADGPDGGQVVFLRQPYTFDNEPGPDFRPYTELSPASVTNGRDMTRQGSMHAN